MGVYGSKPETNKQTFGGQVGRLQVNLSSMKGWRSVMEDFWDVQFNLLPDLHYFALFDGHGGSEVSAFCKAVFPVHLKANPKLAEGKLVEALEDTFLHIDKLLDSPEGRELLNKIHQKSANPNRAGSSAAVILAQGDLFVLATLGKCRAWTVQVGQPPNPISVIRGVRDPEEKERIKAAGGFVSEGRVNDSLTMTRSFGILDYKKNPKLDQKSQILIAVPDIKTFSIDPTLEFILLATDGTFDLFTPQVATDQIRSALAQGGDIQQILNSLLDKGLAKDTIHGIGCNNMTLLSIAFREEGDPKFQVSYGQVQGPPPLESPAVRKKTAKLDHPDLHDAFHSHDHDI